MPLPLLSLLEDGRMSQAHMRGLNRRLLAMLDVAAPFPGRKRALVVFHRLLELPTWDGAPPRLLRERLEMARSPTTPTSTSLRRWQWRRQSRWQAHECEQFLLFVSCQVVATLVRVLQSDDDAVEEAVELLGKLAQTEGVRSSLRTLSLCALKPCTSQQKPWLSM